MQVDEKLQRLFLVAAAFFVIAVDGFQERLNHLENSSRANVHRRLIRSFVYSTNSPVEEEALAEKSRNHPTTPKGSKYSGYNNTKRYTARKPKNKS